MKYLQIGQTASISKTFTEEDLHLFAEVSLDHNPIHFDAEYAAGTIFKKPIVHGLLVASLISGVLGTELPGYGAVYINQNLRFMRPVYVGDTITAKVELIKIDPEKHTVTLHTWCYKQDDQIVIEGEAVLKI